MIKSGLILTVNPLDPEPELIKQAAEHACRKIPIIFPTDTVYGIGIAARNDCSLEALYDVKGRDRDKAIPWLVENVNDLNKYGVDVPEFAVLLAKSHWPGALTLIVKASAAVPVQFRAQDGSIALRAPDCPITLALIEELGVPLATSSANFQGKEPPISFETIDDALLDKVELVIDGGACQKKEASTIVSCLGNVPVIVRQGAIPSIVVRMDAMTYDW